jgi:hypothetical protein
MQKTILKILIVVCFFCFAFTACKKDAHSKSKTELITQQAWQFAKFEGKTNNGAWFDAYPTMASCLKDNRFTYYTNHTYVFDEGATKCDVADPQTSTFSWSFTDYESKLLLNSATYTIDQLDESTLVLSTQSTSGSNTYYSRVTYGH